MNEAESIIRQSMAKNKITHDYELAKRIGITRQSFSRKMNIPRTFTIQEIKAIAEDFHWTDEELGSFIRAI